MTVFAGSDEILDKDPAVLSEPVLGEIGGLQEPRPGFNMPSGSKMPLSSRSRGLVWCLRAKYIVLEHPSLRHRFGGKKTISAKGLRSCFHV
jgi:hypothetical protein